MKFISPLTRTPEKSGNYFYRNIKSGAKGVIYYNEFNHTFNFAGKPMANIQNIEWLDEKPELLSKNSPTI